MMSRQSTSIPRCSAKLLSPFRYPGGKTWLVPRVCRWLHGMDPRPAVFIEPFAGGSIVGLNVAYKRLAGQVTLVEIDEDVAAVWQTILGGNAQSLVDKIVSFELTRETVKAVLSETPRELEQRAFQTILKNRVNRAGILASGAGMLRSGENGKGIKSRWYPETLGKRILEIDRMRERITFVKGDGLQTLKQHTYSEWIASSMPRVSTDVQSITPLSPSFVFFIDPPYTVGRKQAGRRLYRHCELDHEELFGIASRLRGDFLMTYSSDERVRELAKRHHLDTEEIGMRSSHHEKMTELLIGRDLDWIRRLKEST